MLKTSYFLHHLHFFSYFKRKYCSYEYFTYFSGYTCATLYSQHLCSLHRKRTTWKPYKEYRRGTSETQLSTVRWKRLHRMGKKTTKATHINIPHFWKRNKTDRFIWKAEYFKYWVRVIPLTHFHCNISMVSSNALKENQLKCLIIAHWCLYWNNLWSVTPYLEGHT